MYFLRWSICFFFLVGFDFDFDSFCVHAYKIHFIRERNASKQKRRRSRRGIELVSGWCVTCARIRHFNVRSLSICYLFSVWFRLRFSSCGAQFFSDETQYCIVYVHTNPIIQNRKMRASFSAANTTAPPRCHTIAIELRMRRVAGSRMISYILNIFFTWPCSRRSLAAWCLCKSATRVLNSGRHNG